MPVRDRNVGRGSEALDLEYARRENAQSGNLPVSETSPQLKKRKLNSDRRSGRQE